MAKQTTGIAALLTTGRALIKRFTEQRREPGPNLAQLQQFAGLIVDHRAAAGIAADITFDLLPGMADWQDSDLYVEEGDEITLFAAGDIIASRLADVRMAPKIVLWRRIGKAGQMHKVTNAASSFRADHSGRLYVAIKAPGDWENESGDFDAAKPWRDASGMVQVLLVKWREGVERGISVLQPIDTSGFASAALAQWRNPKLPPERWSYMWRLGDGEIYTPGSEHGHICCHTDRDVGILQIPADFALTDTTRFTWKWRATVLPSTLREDIQPTHDYLSIAVEFDNGLDLTYMWSSELPVDTIFQCPLPWWNERETHWVLRSQAPDLGKWLSEERNIKSDYERAIGGPAPKRITGVWLIANSAFQRGEGRIDYADILLSNTDQQLALA